MCSVLLFIAASLGRDQRHIITNFGYLHGTGSVAKGSMVWEFRHLVIASAASPITLPVDYAPSGEPRTFFSETNNQLDFHSMHFHPLSVSGEFLFTR
jgi:hypothetical protein